MLKSCGNGRAVQLKTSVEPDTVSGVTLKICDHDVSIWLMGDLWWQPGWKHGDGGMVWSRVIPPSFPMWWRGTMCSRKLSKVASWAMCSVNIIQNHTENNFQPWSGAGRCVTCSTDGNECVLSTKFFLNDIWKLLWANVRCWDKQLELLTMTPHTNHVLEHYEPLLSYKFKWWNMLWWVTLPQAKLPLTICKVSMPSC